MWIPGVLSRFPLSYIILFILVYNFFKRPRELRELRVSLLFTVTFRVYTVDVKSGERKIRVSARSRCFLLIPSVRLSVHSILCRVDWTGLAGDVLARVGLNDAKEGGGCPESAQGHSHRSGGQGRNKQRCESKRGPTKYGEISSGRNCDGEGDGFAFLKGVLGNCGRREGGRRGLPPSLPFFRRSFHHSRVRRCEICRLSPQFWRRHPSSVRRSVRPFHPS